MHAPHIAARWRAPLVGALLVLALATGLSLTERVATYLHEASAWTAGRGLLLGRAPGPLPGDPEAGAEEAGLRDDFSVDHGPVALCHWDDPYARLWPSLSRVRAVARSRHWAPGSRVRLRINPAQPSECRPAYGWGEFLRLDLTAHILLVILFAGGALFVRLGPRP